MEVCEPNDFPDYNWVIFRLHVNFQGSRNYKQMMPLGKCSKSPELLGKQEKIAPTFFCETKNCQKVVRKSYATSVLADFGDVFSHRCLSQTQEAQNHIDIITAIQPTFPPPRCRKPEKMVE